MLDNLPDGRGTIDRRKSSNYLCYALNCSTEARSQEKGYQAPATNNEQPLTNYQDDFEAVNHVYALSVAYLMEIDMQALIKKGRFRC